jgi:tRNA-specific 2-thiouridylase
LGEHDGAIFYTIGQRHGLDVGGGLPYYVASKDMKKNEVYVTTKLDDERLWSEELNLTSLHWINEPAKIGDKVQARTRHRAELIDSEISEVKKRLAKLRLMNPVRAATPGQSVVIYSGQEVLGGGVIF